jgi:hypothetical protein
MTKILKKQIIKDKAIGRDYTAELLEDEQYDGVVYEVRVSRGVYHNTIKKCNFKPCAEQIYRQTIQKGTLQ